MLSTQKLIDVPDRSEQDVLFDRVKKLNLLINDVGLGCLIIATGIPVYVICVKWKSKPKSFNRLVGMYWTSHLCNFHILTFLWFIAVFNDCMAPVSGLHFQAL